MTIPAGGSKTFDSADFAPSDLKRKGWSAKTDYWFDATVAAADATYPSGAQALSADLIHDGEKDKAQHFALTFSGGPGDFSTQAQGTFSTAGGTSIVHDRLVVTTGADSLADDLSVRVTLNWASSPTATKAEASATKADVVPAGSDHKDLRDFAPSDLKMPAWKAGRYWYDVDIPAQDGVDDAITLHGLTKDTAKESWTVVTPFGLDLAKLAYIGQPGQGRWSNEPVKGAVFTLTETTDQTGSTVKPGTAVRTVTTDANGSAHLLDGVIGATGDRWFRLAETKAPASYALPSSGTYWMVHVKGGADQGGRHGLRLQRRGQGAAQGPGRLDRHGRQSARGQHHAADDRRTLRRGPRGRVGRRGHARPAHRRVRGPAPQERIAARQVTHDTVKREAPRIGLT